VNEGAGILTNMKDLATVDSAAHHTSARPADGDAASNRPTAERMDTDCAEPDSLAQHLRQRLAQEGPLPWPDVMAAALYQPGLGYYAREVRRVGRRGDFYTAVSVGPLYGTLLAELAVGLWETAGRPTTFIIAEQAAHDGQLAADLWHALEQHPLGAVVSWVIIDPQPLYRERQAAHLMPLMGERVSWLSEISELAGVGLLLANELLDALPVNRLTYTSSGWQDHWVTATESGFEFELRTSTDPERHRLPTGLPLGYTTETHGAMAAWAQGLAQSPWQGAVLIADYGYDWEDYYRPERSEGTLRRYTQHRTDGHVLAEIGDCDLTAHIEFTRLTEALGAGGYQLLADLPQGRFLGLVGHRWLSSLPSHAAAETVPGLLRQYQALTHPGHMGAAFRMLLMGRGLTSGYRFPRLSF
jgi:SAM-dependent MidA family methyltransferase